MTETQDRPKRKAKLKPASAEERQAASTLKAAKVVASEIEALKNVVRDERRSGTERQDAKQALFEATERLCNIMGLAVFQLSASLSAEFQHTLSEGFRELRHRLLHMGVHLMVERIDKIHKRAAAVLQGEAYPIGLAMRLRAAYVELTNNLTSLQAESMLSEEQRQLILNTSGMIDRLAEIEERLGMIIELTEDGDDMPTPEARRSW